MLGALRNAGLGAEKVLREVEAERQLDAAEKARKNKKIAEKSNHQLTIMRETGSVRVLRRAAHKHLLEHPDDIGEVLDIAHERTELLKTAPRGRTFIPELLKLRAQLQRPGLTAVETGNLIRRLLPQK